MAKTNQMECSGSVAYNLRNVRYCEAIPVTVDGDTQTSWVYNTLCLNDCPSKEWDALTVDEATQEYKQEYPNTVAAKLNGPRYWVIDQLDGFGSSTTGKEFTFGGIEMALRAQLQSKVGESTVGDAPWVPRQVQRDTVYTYQAGKPVYELTSPEGAIYIMQSYSQQVQHLTIDELSSLEHRLEFPTDGWTYSARTLEEDYVLTTNGVATIINDNFYNTYQQRN